MKYLKSYDEKCIGCNTCVTACAMLFFKEDKPEKSCIELISLGDDNFKLSVCNQCGECIEACPAEAISMNKQGVVMISKKSCSGCMVCVDACPTGNMGVFDEALTPFKCTACGACAKECPADALEVVIEK
ncbi:MAG: 4Fe-4S binding protein [Candidatus Aminicenantes bacterium]|nr:4Fe-4S binding protein [Candidatus Aminicenantes bacterium]